MNGGVPVQFTDCVIPPEGEQVHAENGVCGTCTKCGKAAQASLNRKGTPRQRRAEAVGDVLATLAGECEQRLPWGVPPNHYDRRIPKGVSLAVEDRGRLWALAVDPKGKLLSVAGGRALDARVLVIPANIDAVVDASEFKMELVRRGYVRAEVVAVNYQPKPLAAAAG